MKDYHLESLASFQAYKQFYTEQAVPVLSEQQSMEAALTEAEPRAATDAEVCLPVFSHMYLGCCNVCSTNACYLPALQPTLCTMFQMHEQMC